MWGDRHGHAHTQANRAGNSYDAADGDVSSFADARPADPGPAHLDPHPA